MLRARQGPACLSPASKDLGVLSGLASWSNVCRLAGSSPVGLLASASILVTTAGRSQDGRTLVCPLPCGCVFRLFLKLSVDLHVRALRASVRECLSEGGRAMSLLFAGVCIQMSLDTDDFVSTAAPPTWSPGSRIPASFFSTSLPLPGIVRHTCLRACVSARVTCMCTCVSLFFSFWLNPFNGKHDDTTHPVSAETENAPAV